MTGRDDELLPEGVPAFDDPAYDALRAELGDLGEVGPMPAVVVARLDDVLAGLGGTPFETPAEPSAEEPPTDAPVVPLRRRSNAGKRLLVAAAAVVAVGGGGIGLANVVQGGSDDAGSASKAADADAVPELAAGGDTGSTADQSGGDALAYAGGVPALTSSRFAADAEQLIGSDTTLAKELRQSVTKAPRATATNRRDSEYDAGATPSPTSPVTGLSGSPVAPDAPEEGDNLLNDGSGSLDRLSSCAVDAVAGGVARAILLDDVPAVLVIYPAVDGSRLVQARSCDAQTVLISAFVPVS